MRFGLLGLGWAARALALPALRSLPSVQVVAGCDASSEQRTSWEGETGIPAVGGLEELVQRGVDAVVIATPPASHARLCIDALGLGLHVVCEKPFVMSLAEADAVMAAAASAGKQVAINHEFRREPIFEAVQAQVAAERYGRLVFCQMWQLMDLAPWDEPAAWRAAMASQALLEGGIHLVDLMLPLFGSVPKGVYARHSPGIAGSGREGDAIHLLTLDFPDGRLGQITIDRLCQASTRYLELRADCERASLRASIGGRAALQIGKKRAERTGIRLDVASGGMAWAEQGVTRTTLARNPRNAVAGATRTLFGDIVGAFREDREPPSSAREARIVLAVIEAAYESARAGRRIELTELLEPEPVGHG